MPNAAIMGTLYMFMPMISVFIVQKLVYKEPIKIPLGISFKLNFFFLMAWLIPPFLAFATLGVSLLFPGIEFSPEMAGIMAKLKMILPPEEWEKAMAQTKSLPLHPFWLALIQGMVGAITINAVISFGEEIGWRGFLQKEFESLSFWKSSFLIGFIWGLWHAPVILMGHNYPEHPQIGVLMMIIWCILLGPLFSYIRIKARSVIATCILHGSLNGTAGLAIMVVKGGSDLTVGLTGVAGFFVLVFVNIVLFAYDQLANSHSYD
ncbi:MAG: CPBP family intramembrane metalloprotease [Spirochaetes bacterium]|nr:CPBP family intramembrane metalloprotease [Spirochaetota bacterium]